MKSLQEAKVVLTERKPSIASLSKSLAILQQHVETKRLAPQLLSAEWIELSIEAEDVYLNLLKLALQAAISLEFATIPPYLCALWSIENDTHIVAKSIREVVQEEMLHMSLACNMLVSLGGVPNINKDTPSYPTTLPGGVHPKLKVGLSSLTPDSVKVFKEIERPEHTLVDGDGDVSEDDYSISKFYQRIEQAFIDIQPTIVTDNQISAMREYTIIENLDEVRQAISLIRRQGEGSRSSPADTGLNDLSHYYRFSELHHGKKLIYDKVTDKYVYGGEEIEWPEVLPMQDVPDGGYMNEDVSSEALHLLIGFDSAYTQLLDFLQSAWSGGGQASFIRAIESMFELEKYAKPLMKIPAPGTKHHTLGPCFRYLSRHSV